MVDRFFTPEGVEMKISLKTKRVLAKLLEGCSVDMDDYTPKEQNEVGLCYWYGHIVPLNYEEAVKWYKVSAEKKHKDAVLFNRVANGLLDYKNMTPEEVKKLFEESGAVTGLEIQNGRLVLGETL